MSHIGDGKLFAIGDALMQLQKRTWCHISSRRETEIQLILEIVHKLDYNVEVDTTLDGVTRIFISNYLD
jgi:hypothetical protein